MTFAKRFVQLFLSFVALISPVFAEIAHPYHLDATMIPADGIGQLGEPVKLSCKLFKSGNLAVGEKLRIVTKWESNEISNKTIVFDGKPFEISYKSDKPGWVYFCIQVLDKDGKVIPAPGTQVKQLKKENILFEAGAMFAPDKIVAVPSMPKDFEEFWQQEKKALEALPMDVKLQKCKLTGDIAKQVQCFAVEINCLGRTPVTGYLAYPIDAKPGELAAIVDFQSKVWKDVPPKRAAYLAASAHSLQFYVTWHGFPLGKTQKYYQKLRKKDYEHDGAKGIEDRKQWIYHDMFLRDLRALQYIKTNPLWNKRDLIVRGGSLGGAQCVAAAALEDKTTVAIIGVPGFCELNGGLSGRKDGWMLRRNIPVEQRTQRLFEQLAYHDAVNFAKLIKCKTFVCTGFADEVCYPSSVYAMYNAIPGNVDKKMTASPYTGHYGTTKDSAAEKFLGKGGEGALVQHD